ncbi:MAG TPA: hypothetical protein VK066_07535 [Chloroflexota bacterium]|nr:hypothetical protein [Chloroflexota bacterium]
MAPLSDPRRVGHSAPYQRDTSSATLFALLVVIAVPALVVALAAGWRPLSGSETDALLGWVGRLTGRAAPTAAVAAPSDWAIPNGWFYTEVPGDATGPDARGFAVSDANGMRFWSEYQRLGGPTYMGYPLSRRFDVDGGTAQVFQRAVLRYDTAADRVVVTRLLDRLSREGQDAELQERWSIPPLDVPAPPDVTAEVLDDRLKLLLSDYPAIRTYFADAPDAPALFGAPTSAVQETRDFYVIRFQNGALQQWKHDVPWANAGDVTAVNVGQIAAALGLFPAEALQPLPAATAGTLALK